MIKCDYCGNPAKLVTGKEVYPHHPDLHRLNFWQCAPCGAFVGCHKKEGGNGDGTKPLGRLANAELRAARKRAHAAFDPVWREGHMKRKQAYDWLAKELQIPAAQCHIGMMDLETCRRAVAACTATCRTTQDATETRDNATMHMTRP